MEKQRLTSSLISGVIADSSVKCS